MATFQAPKGYKFADDTGVPWAEFTQVSEAEGTRTVEHQPVAAVYQFETTDATTITKLQANADVTEIA